MDKGSINVEASDKSTHQGAIIAGTYRVEGIPIGDVKIGVIGNETMANPAESAQAQDQAPNPRIAKMRERRKKELGSITKHQPISHTYGDAEKSGLKTTVKGGENTYDLDLK